MSTVDDMIFQSVEIYHLITMDSFEQIISVARAVTSDLSKYSEELEHIATIKAQLDHAESWKKQQEQEIADTLKGFYFL